MTENWKDIPDYEGRYQVSDSGRVKSVVRKNRLTEKIMKPHPDKDGYMRVGLREEGKLWTTSIHRLVMLAFVGPCPEGKQVDHENQIKDDNNLSNLRYVTSRQNCSNRTTKGSSKYIGVCWNKKNQNWLAGIRINGKKKHLGSFAEELDASNAYQEALAGLQKNN